MADVYQNWTLYNVGKAIKNWTEYPFDWTMLNEYNQLVSYYDNVKWELRTSIINKWVNVPASASIDTYPWYIDQIKTETPFLSTMPLRCLLGYWQWNSGYRDSMSCPLSFTYWDYMFWAIQWATYNSSQDYFQWNFFAYKEWWSDYKLQETGGIYDRNGFYFQNAGYIVNDNNTISLWLSYTNVYQGQPPFSTTIATFDLWTWNWVSTSSGTDSWLEVHWNDLFSSVQFDPRVYNFYGTKTPLVMLTPKTS